MLLTLEVEVDVCVAVPELVEGVAPVHAAVLQARVLDGQRQNVLVLLQRTAPVIVICNGFKVCSNSWNLKKSLKA